jgi:hypothetical protein
MNEPRSALTPGAKPGPRRRSLRSAHSGPSAPAGVRPLAAVLGTLLLAAAPASAQLRIDESARRDGVALARAGYDYAPSVIFDGSWRLWWCGSGVAGDFIYSQAAPGPGGPWSPLRVALASSYTPGPFDGQHTCDPSVIRIGGASYLYYGGFPMPGSSWSPTTRIGVARSTDGVTWVRLNGGQPILSPRGDPFTRPNRYGAGQPSAIYLDGYVYLLYTDTTGQASNPFNGGGVYVIRSRDPLFQGAVEELSREGGAVRFVTRRSVRELSTSFALWDATSVDWMFSDVLQSFVLAVNGILGQTNILVFDRSLTRLTSHLVVPRVPWVEGAGFARQLDGHTLPHGTGSTARVPLILFYPTGVPGQSNAGTWDLNYVGVDIVR